VLDHLDARATRAWAVRALAALGRCREEIDALNVFPVPDGDTGTNLFLTFEAACAAVASLPQTADLPAVADSFARGALLGARGNSGIILSQLMRGWVEAVAGRPVMDAEGFRIGLRAGDSRAWDALAAPVEGTVLSVSRAAADAVDATVLAMPCRPRRSSCRHSAGPGSSTPVAVACSSCWWPWTTSSTSGRPSSVRCGHPGPARRW